MSISSEPHGGPNGKQPTSPDIVAAALGLAGEGWPVFPCGRDKRPVTEHGFKDASRDPAIIRSEGFVDCCPDRAAFRIRRARPRSASRFRQLAGREHPPSARYQSPRDRRRRRTLAVPSRRGTSQFLGQDCARPRCSRRWRLRDRAAIARLQRDQRSQFGSLATGFAERTATSAEDCKAHLRAAAEDRPVREAISRLRRKPPAGTCAVRQTVCGTRRYWPTRGR
jgi:Bifunctional DNA primase/polymerase, N-terminal